MHEHTDKLAALIPFGRENAISRKKLAEALHMSDRKTRAAIEDARADGIIIINSQNGAGYFQTTDLEEMLRQYRQDTARALSIFRRRKPLREALIAAGVRVDDGLLTVCRDMHGRFAPNTPPKLAAESEVCGSDMWDATVLNEQQSLFEEVLHGREKHS